MTFKRQNRQSLELLPRQSRRFSTGTITGKSLQQLKSHYQSIDNYDIGEEDICSYLLNPSLLSLDIHRPFIPSFDLGTLSFLPVELMNDILVSLDSHVTSKVLPLVSKSWRKVSVDPELWRRKYRIAFGEDIPVHDRPSLSLLSTSGVEWMRIYLRRNHIQQREIKMGLAALNAKLELERMSTFLQHVDDFQLEEELEQ